MMKIFKYVDDAIGEFKFLPVKMPIAILKVRSEELTQTIFIKRPAHLLDLHNLLMGAQYADF